MTGNIVSAHVNAAIVQKDAAMRSFEDIVFKYKGAKQELELKRFLAENTDEQFEEKVREFLNKQDLEMLTRLLANYPEGPLRWLVIEAIERKGDNRVAPLIQDLKTYTWKNNRYHSEAADALVRIGTPAVPALIDVLRVQGLHFGVQRHLAVEALGKIGDIRAIPALIEVLREWQSPHLIAAASDALKIIGEPAVPALIKTLREVKEHSGDYLWSVALSGALVKIGTPAVPALIKILEDPSDKGPYLDYYAADALGKIEDQRAVPILIKSMDNPKLAGTAAIALGRIGDETALPVLIQALDNKEISGAAAIALAKIGEALALPALTNALKKDGNEEIIKALGELGDATTASELIEFGLTGGGSNFVVQALHNINDENTTPTLVVALKGSDKNRVTNAARMLREMHWSPTSIEDKVLFYMALPNWEELSKIGEPAIPAIVDAWKKYGYFMAPQALAKMGWQPTTVGDRILFYSALQNWDELSKVGQPALPTLLEALNREKDSKKRSVIIESLGKIGGPEVEAKLVGMLSTQDTPAALRALGIIGWQPSTNEDKILFYRTLGKWDELIKMGEVAVPVFVEMLNGSWQPLYAAQSLGEIGGEEAVSALIAALKQKNLYVFAVNALGKTGDQRAVPVLIDLLKYKDHNECLLVAEALVKIGPLAVPALIEALNKKDTNPKERYFIIDTLGKIGDKTAVPALRKTLKNKTELTVTVQALEKLGWKPTNEEDRISFYMALGKWDELAKIGPPAVPTLIAALPRNTYAAVHALEKIDDPRVIPAFIAEANTMHSDPVIVALGKMGDKRAVPVLIEVLKARNGLSAVNVVEALENIGDSTAIPVLVEAFKDEKETFYNIRAARALDKMGWQPQTSSEKARWRTYLRFKTRYAPKVTEQKPAGELGVADGAMLTSNAGFTRKKFIATIAVATGAAFLGKFTFNYLDYKKNPTNMPGSASDKIVSGSVEWQQMHKYLEQAIQDASLSGNPLYLKSIKAFQSAAQDHLYANRPGVPASAVAVINQGRYSHSAVRINVSLIEKLLTKSVTQPVYKLLAWAVLLKEGRTVLDQEARPDFYVRLAILKSKLNGLSDDELEEFMARLVTAEAVGYAQMGRFLKDGIGEDVVSEIRQLYNQENDPIIKSLLGYFIDPVYAANIKASGLPAEQQKVIKELFLKTMILSKVQLNPPVRKQFDAHMAGNFQVDMTRIYDLQFATNPQLLSKMTFLLKPEYLLPKDEAMVTNMPINGGIDLDRSKMQMNVNMQGEGVQMQFDSAMIQRIKKDGFNGIDFKIESIVPVANLPLFLGLKESEESEKLAGV